MQPNARYSAQKRSIKHVLDARYPLEPCTGHLARSSHSACHVLVLHRATPEQLLKTEQLLRRPSGQETPIT
jgi:hypothetical protein